MLKAIIFFALLSSVAGASIGYAEESAPPKSPLAETPKKQESLEPGPRQKNDKLLSLKPNEWTLIHEHKDDAPAFAHKGAHFGLCFDPVRGWLVMFGSQVRGTNCLLSNSLFFFDVAKEAWTQSYPDDKEDAYRVTDEGVAVAGSNGNHPWATSGATANFVYIPDRDAVMHTVFDGHVGNNDLLQEKANAKEKLRGKQHLQPMWLYSLAKGQWEAIPFKGQGGKIGYYWRYYNPFVYDPDRKVLIGVSKSEVIENSPADFSTFAGVVSFKGPFSLMTGCYAVYSPKHKSVFCYSGQDVWVYDIAKKEMIRMPTPGNRPPDGSFSPMVFDPRSGKVVVVVCPQDAAEDEDKAKEATKGKLSTWIYDYERDAWSRLSGKDLTLESCRVAAVYDPLHQVILLVSRAGHEKPKVFALNYVETAEKSASAPGNSTDAVKKPEGAPEKP